MPFSLHVHATASCYLFARTNSERMSIALLLTRPRHCMAQLRARLLHLYQSLSALVAYMCRKRWSRDYPRIGNPREKGICFGLHRADFYLRPTRSILRVCDTVQALWSRWEACGNTQSSSTLLHWAHRADTRSNKKRIVKRVSRSLRTNPLYTYPRNLHSQLIASDESMFGLAI